MKGRFATRVLGLLAAVVMTVLLWRYWSDLCNEACPPAKAVTMILLAPGLPLLMFLVVWELTAMGKRRRKTLVIEALLLAVFILAGVWVSVSV